jgi:hypothetical protein
VLTGRGDSDDDKIGWHLYVLGSEPEDYDRPRLDYYYTIDLHEVLKLPPRSATYQLYALREEYVSNVITIKVEAYFAASGRPRAR